MADKAAVRKPVSCLNLGAFKLRIHCGLWLGVTMLRLDNEEFTNSEVSLTLQTLSLQFTNHLVSASAIVAKIVKPLLQIRSANMGLAPQPYGLESDIFA